MPIPTNADLDILVEALIQSEELKRAETSDHSTCELCQVRTVLSKNEMLRTLAIDGVAALVLGDASMLQQALAVSFVLGMRFAQSNLQQSSGIQAEIAELEKMFNKKLDNEESL